MCPIVASLELLATLNPPSDFSFTSVNSQPTVTAEYTAGLSVFTVKHITPQMHHSWTTGFWFWLKMSWFLTSEPGNSSPMWTGASEFPSFFFLNADNRPGQRCRHMYTYRQGGIPFRPLTAEDWWLVELESIQKSPSAFVNVSACCTLSSHHWNNNNYISPKCSVYICAHNVYVCPACVCV